MHHAFYLSEESVAAQESLDKAHFPCHETDRGSYSYNSLDQRTCSRLLLLYDVSVMLTACFRSLLFFSDFSNISKFKSKTNHRPFRSRRRNAVPFSVRYPVVISPQYAAGGLYGMGGSTRTRRLSKKGWQVFRGKNNPKTWCLTAHHTHRGKYRRRCFLRTPSIRPCEIQHMHIAPWEAIYEHS